MAIELYAQNLSTPMSLEWEKVASLPLEPEDFSLGTTSEYDGIAHSPTATHTRACVRISRILMLHDTRPPLVTATAITTLERRERRLV